MDLKDISDPDIINLVKSNMEIKINKKIMQKNLNLIHEGEYLFIVNN